MEIHYIDQPPIDDGNTTREFQSALAAFRCGDANPMRLFLGLELKIPCDDCGDEHVCFPWDKHLICEECHTERHVSLCEWMDNRLEPAPAFMEA